MRFGTALDTLMFLVGCAATGLGIGVAATTVWKLAVPDQQVGKHSDPVFQKRFREFMANVDPGPPMSHYAERLEKMPPGSEIEIPGAPFVLRRGG